MDNSLGILVWTALIAGSAMALFLALRDVLVWCVGVIERIHDTDREALEHRSVVPTITIAGDRSGEKEILKTS